MTPPESHRARRPEIEHGAHKPSVFAERRRQDRLRAKVRSFTIASVAILLLSGVPQLASAASPPHHALQVLSLTESATQGGAVTQNYTVGQTIYISGIVTGGILHANASCVSWLCVPGYDLLFFFGQSNNSGNLSYQHESIAPPSGCKSTSTACPNWSHFNFSTTYHQPGSYNWSLTVYDANFGWIIATRTVEISVAQFNVTIANHPKWATLGYPTHYNATAYLPGTVPDQSATYTWDFGDGHAATGASVSNIFMARGQYVVTVTARDAGTGWAARNFTEENVSQSPPGSASITMSPCDGPGPDCQAPVWDPVTFSASAYEPNPYEANRLVFFWNFSDGTYATSGQTPSSTWPHQTDPGRWSVTANVTHIFTRAAWYHMNVTVGAPDGTSSRTQYDLQIVSPNRWVTVPGLSVPVGQVVQPNATQALLSSPQLRNVSGTALENFSWSYTGAVSGRSWGSVGSVASEVPGSGTANLTITNPNGTGHTWGNSTSLSWHDVRPTVGIDQIYTPVTVKMWTPSWAAVAHVNLTGDSGLLTSVSGHYATVPNFVQEIYGGDQIVVAVPDPLYSSPFTGFLNVSYYGNASTQSVPLYFCYSPGFHGCYQESYTENMNSLAYKQEVFYRGSAFSPGWTGLNTSVSYSCGLLCGFSTTFTCQRPVTVEPAICYFGGQLLYLAQGSGNINQTLVASTYDWNGWYGYGNVTFSSVSSELWASDTAPVATLNLAGFGASPTILVDAEPNFRANVSYSGSHDSLNWSWGDGTVTSRLNAPNTLHLYQLGGRYLVALTSRSATAGESTANWTWMTVQEPHPLANFSVYTTKPLAGGVTLLESNGTSEDIFGEAGLAYAWVFCRGTPCVPGNPVYGNNGAAGGLWGAGAYANHVFKTGGTYTVNLTVQNTEGGVSSFVRSFSVAYDPVAFNVGFLNATVDRFAPASTLNITSAPVPEYPLLNITWQWAVGGSAYSEKYGYQLDPGSGYFPGPTYLSPKGYRHDGMHWWLNVTATTVFGVSSHASINWSAHIPAVGISIADQGYVSYGERTDVALTAISLGTLWERNSPSSVTLSYRWVWADGDVSPVYKTTSTTDQAMHYYNLSGLVELDEWTNYSSFEVSSSVLNVTVIPDSDGDGLPNAVEATVRDSFYEPMTGISPNMAQQGVGLTNAVNYLGNIGSLNSDPDGDGLTTFQEVTGSITGFPSNPLDANTAGDGIPDGAHFFTDSFPQSEVTYFGTGTSSGNVAQTAIPGVGYYGPAIAFNQSRLVVQLNESAGGPPPSPANGVVSLALRTPGGRNITLGTPQSGVQTYYLLNSSPTKGPWGPYGLSVSDLSQPGTWTLWETAAGSAPKTVNGTVPSATLFVSYYTNPGQADPTRQGLLQGHGLSTPVFNCSAPHNETFTVFDPRSLTLHNVTYWPYTETYYKLSVMQGVPYNTTQNSALLNGINTGTTCTGTTTAPSGGLVYPLTYSAPSSGLYQAIANYLGDADFGISPWEAYFADGSHFLTNGMKALGATSYNWTRGQYLLTGASSLFASAAMCRSSGWVTGACNGGFSGYASDNMHHYYGPLNPTANSTAGDGVNDSVALSPLGPLGLNVTIHYANDPTCYTDGLILDSLEVPQYIMSVSQYTQQGALLWQVPAGVQDYTGTGSNSNTGSCALSTGNYYQASWGSSSGVSYFFPLNRQFGTFNLDLQLWLNNALTPQPAVDYAQISKPIIPGLTYWTNTGSTGINASVTVETIQRANTILVNTSSDVENLTGYGYRYTGEQQFYAFDLGMGTNLPSSADPWIFQPGLNVILESRAAFLNSSVGNSSRGGIGLVDGLPGMAGANASVRSGTNGSQVAAAATWQADLSAGSSYQSSAASLLYQLLPLNATGNHSALSAHKGWLVLNTTQVELLGLSNQSLMLVPFVVPLAQQTPSGPGPSSLVGQAAKALQQAWDNFVVALSNFLTTVYHYLQQVGQWIVGAFQAAASAVSAAVNAAVNAIGKWVSALLSFIGHAANVVLGPVLNEAASFGLNFYRAVLAENATISNGSFVTGAELHQLWDNFTGILFALCVTITIALLILIGIIDGFSLGSASLLGVIVSILVSALILTYGAIGFNSASSPRLPVTASIGHGISDLNNASTQTTWNAPATTPVGQPHGVSSQLGWNSFFQTIVGTADGIWLLSVADAGPFFLTWFTPGWVATATYPVITVTILTMMDFTLAIVTLLLDYFDSQHPNNTLEEWALGIGALGILGDIASLGISLAAHLDPWTELDFAVSGVGGVGEVTAVYLYCQVNTCPLGIS